MRTLWLVMMVSIGLSGCVANHYDTFLAKNPDAWVDWPPPTGAGMHEVLAGLYAPPRAKWRRSVTKIDVIRLDGPSPQLLSDAEIKAALQGDSTGSYGVVAIQGCHSVEGTQGYRGQKVAWFVFPNGVLHAWDAFAYADHCLVSNLFNPASKEHTALEEKTIAWMRQHFPESMRHTSQFYQQGIAYLSKGRIEEARQSLEEGDKTHDVGLSGRGGGRRDHGWKARSTQLSDIQRLRQQLRLAIAMAEEEAGLPSSEPVIE